MRQARDETNSDWVGSNIENDRDCLRCRLGSLRSRCAGRNDDCYLTTNQILGQCRQPIAASPTNMAWYLKWLRQAAAMVLYGVARAPATAIFASIVAGVSWIGVVATLTVSAQVPT